jgi:YbgC/YbaW family acyl-CoA thioester hydrolase
MKSFDPSLYQHSISFPVRFMDIDALNHVNNARYLNYLEEARIAYSRELLNTYHSIEDLKVLVARVEIDYLYPIKFGSEVKVYTRISKVGTKSFNFECVICGVSGGKETPAAFSNVTLVSFDPISEQSVEIDPELKKRIMAFEKL